MSKIQIVSGGQTGVDRAALDAALTANIPIGGWCPEDREAEDGVIDSKYPLKELTGAGYRQRTKMNVVDSDGTVIIYFSYPSGGTEQTLASCLKLKKPYLLIDADEISEARSAQKIADFVSEESIKILNVAGPRQSGEERAYSYTFKALSLFLENSAKSENKRPK